MPDYKDNSDQLYRDDDDQAEQPPESTGAGHAPDDPSRAELQAERDQLYQRLQRVSADYANALKRHQQQLTGQVELAKGDLLKSFIPVLDHFDNALATEPTDDEARSLHHGLAIVRDELLKVLQREGVEQIEVEVGSPFDPGRHEAMFPQSAEGVEPNHVTQILQPGYVYGNRILRAAKVAVAPGD